MCHRPDIPDDFKSDGCTGVPDCGFTKCCRGHDWDYMKGTNEWHRLCADWRFYMCMLRSGNPIIATIYFIGIVLIGWISFYGLIDFSKDD